MSEPIKSYYSAVEVADYFVLKSEQDNEQITNMKLQKMVYFAYGLLLVDSNKTERLIRESIQAWQFGPVIPEVYNKFKEFGAGDIVSGKKIYSLLGKNNFISKITFENENHKKILDDTYTFLKEITPIQLSNWTHKDGSAWEKVYNADERHIELNDDDIFIDFSVFLKKEEDVKS